MSRGVLIIATGDGDYQKLARIAVQSIVRHNPGLPVLTHRGKGNGLDSRVEKLRMFQVSPFDETIYLDCDVVVQADITPLFDMIPCAPHVGMALDFGPKTCEGIVSHRFFKWAVPKSILTNLERKVPGDAPHFNSGVVVFRKMPTAAKFFKDWANVWHSRPPAQDQVALIEACSKTGVFPTLLPPEWNYQHSFTRNSLELEEDASEIKILHLAGIKKKELYLRAQASGLL